MKAVKSNNKTYIYGNSVETFDKIPAGYYSIKYQDLQGWWLEDYEPISITEKIYGVHEEKVHKVLKSFKRSTKNLGVILSGPKGIGKSLFAKMVAIESVKQGYPVIIASTYINGMSNFINSITQECVVLFDEFDKMFGGNSDNKDTLNDPQTEMLTLFDGLSTGKKLFIITCNDLTHISSYLVNRPGRFHYHFRFDYPDKNGITEYLKDNNIPDSEIDKVVTFSSRVKLNYDCLRAIVFELSDGSKFEDIIDDLNIINTDGSNYNIQLHFTDGSVLKATETLDLFDSDEQKIYFRTDPKNKYSEIICTVTINPNDVIFSEQYGQFVEAKNCDLKWGYYIKESLDIDLEDKDTTPEEKADYKKAIAWTSRKVQFMELKLSRINRYSYSLTV